MQEQSFSSQISWIHANYHLTPHHTQLITHFLSTTPHHQFKLFLKALITHQHNISFHTYKTILRIIQRTSQKFMDQQLHDLLSELVKQALPIYFPYAITPHNLPSFHQLLRLAKPLNPIPTSNLHNQQQLTLYLSANNCPQQFANAFVEIINNEILMDKKNRNHNAITLNKYMSTFITTHFNRILPQLHRLLVRSTNNIEVWQQFFNSIAPCNHLQPYIIELLSTIKPHLLTLPQHTITLVNSLTSAIHLQHTAHQVVQLLCALLNNQHQSRKKITIIQMLQGIIQSTTNNHQLTNQIFIAFINSWIKFSQQDDFKIIMTILHQLLPLKQPSKEIVQCCKNYIKSTNKHLMVCLGITLMSFNHQHFAHYPSLTTIQTHFQNEIVKLNKLQTSWQYIPYLINFISINDQSNLEYFNEDFPIFKKVALELHLVERKHIIAIILNLIHHLQSSQQSIPQYLLLSLAWLLENTRDRQIWLLVNKLSPSIRVNIISKVVYPSLWFNSIHYKSKTIKPFESLTRLILSLSKWQVDITNQQAYRVLIVASLFHIEVKPKGQPNQKTIQHYLKVSLYNHEVDEKVFPIARRVKMCRVGGQVALGLLVPNFIYSSLTMLLHHTSYQDNLKHIQKWKQQLEVEVNLHYEQLQRDRKVLQESDMYVEEKPTVRKIYGHDTNIKMMSELEVKNQKYRKHFLEMHYYFNSIIQLILQKATANTILPQIWGKFMTPIISITKYPEHRQSVYLITKKSCQEFYKQCLKKGTPNDGIIFYSFSSFIGDLLIIKGAQMTPTIKTMQNCEKFLKRVIEMQLQKIENSYILNFINVIGESILENMQFDVSLKKQVVQLYAKYAEKKLSGWNPSYIFTNLVKNLNILSSSNHISQLMQYCIQQIQPSRCSELFDQILNFIDPTKKLILQTVYKFPNYKPIFEDYIKLRILSLQNSQQIQQISKSILERDESHAKQIINFNMKKFIENNSKQTIEKLCQFMRECMSVESAPSIFQMATQTALQLYNQNFDEQGLQFFPYLVSLNIDFIQVEFLQPIFDLLIMYYTTNPKHATLSKLSLELGVQIIKKYAPMHGNKILQVLESYINKAKGISNIIFLGVLAPYLNNKNSSNFVEKRITGLFEGDYQTQQKAIAKCMPDLMSFFKQPLKKIDAISSTIKTLNEKLQIGQSYLLVGLLKGVGPVEALKRLDQLLDDNYPFKAKLQKSARLWQLYVFAEILGRVVEIKALRFTELIISATADPAEDIRQLARKTGQVLIMKMSSYTVKQLLPHLLKGLENEQNWRIKISYIWILGIMAHSSAKQLQTSLPIIVPTLSSCLSNAHPTIRDKAAEALSLIGQTIKNPQISQTIEILIEALENPFQKSQRALDVLLKTRFAHYIDPPSLSIIIPIVDYCLRGRKSQLKAGACQILGSMCQLIQDPYTLLPYIKLIVGGLRVALCDPLSQIRGIAAKCIGMMSNKIGSVQAENNFKFVIDIIESPLSNTTEKQGSAQAFSEMICSQDYDYFEQSLNKIFDKLSQSSNSMKQGYILVFLYVPGIKTQQFQGFIKQVNSNMYAFVSDEDENIRNSAMQVEKVLINNYCISHTDLLLQPLCEGIFESNWRKRNSALILIGEMLNLIKSHMYNYRSNEKAYAYYQGLMAVYILKDDELEMPRMTANQVWNAYIENTPKTIKTGLKELVKMWTRFTHAANGVVFTNIVGFSGKYGQNYFFEILQFLDEIIDDKLYRKGVFQVLTQFVKRLTQQFLSKENYKAHIRQFYSKYILVIESDVRQSLAKSMALYVEKMHQEVYFEQLVYPQINKMQSLSQEDPSYTNTLHLIRDFLHTSSKIVVDRLLKKIFELPLSNFKVEVITNNADRIANHLYTHFSKPAVNILLEQIYTIANKPDDENRLKLLVYCLNQVSIHLNTQFRTKYIDLITNSIRELTNTLENNKQQKLNILSILLEMVLYFLRAIPIEELENLQTLISDVSVLINAEGKVVVLTHKIYLLLLSHPKSDKTHLYFKQLLVSLEVNVEGNSIWNNDDVVQQYMTVIVQSLAYGSSTVMQEVIKLVGFMLSKSKKQIMEKQIIRLMGPVIRVTNYPLTPSQKLTLLDFIHTIFDLGFKIDVYHSQILSVCYRALYELRTNHQVYKITAIIFEDLLQQSPRKIDIITSIITKLKGLNDNLVRSVYYFVKNLISKQDSLSKIHYQFVQKELKNYLIQSQLKPTAKVIYYLSKTITRIAVFLGQNIKTYQNQINSITCSYQSLLQFLHFSYYGKLNLPKLKQIELFLNQSPREKVYHLLKSIKLCTKYSQSTKATYSLAYLNSLVPQNLRGFDDICDVLQNFE